MLDLHEHRRKARSRQRLARFNCASSSGTSNQYLATPPDSTMSQVSLIRRKEFDDLLQTESVNSFDDTA